MAAIEVINVSWRC